MHHSNVSTFLLSDVIYYLWSIQSNLWQFLRFLCLATCHLKLNTWSFQWCCSIRQKIKIQHLMHCFTDFNHLYRRHWRYLSMFWFCGLVDQQQLIKDYQQQNITWCITLLKLHQYLKSFFLDHFVCTTKTIGSIILKHFRLQILKTHFLRFFFRYMISNGLWQKFLRFCTSMLVAMWICWLGALEGTFITKLSSKNG